MIKKQDLIELLQKEIATTLRVMWAYPSDALDFTPHERSQTARRLMSTFVFEAYLLETYVLGETIDPTTYKTYAPADLETLIADFTMNTAKVINAIKDMSEQDLETKQIEFAGKHFNANTFIVMMLHDQIHHRGQLSTYVRMAGGKVPSIYGPSADDTSTNL